MSSADDGERGYEENDSQLKKRNNSRDNRVHPFKENKIEMDEIKRSPADEVNERPVDVFLEQVGLSQAVLIEPLARDDETEPHADFRKDLSTIIFCNYLYFLQGIPLGLAGAIPLILGARKVGFSAQGTFSLAMWPFSLKLLWAPIVDSLYIKRIGRRRTWIVPVFACISIFMFSSAHLANRVLNYSETQTEIFFLAVIFMAMTFLVATQDVVVDGWAISLLSRGNKHWQSICNTAGQTAGLYIGNNLFLVLESPNFSNQYIRPLFNLPEQATGVIDLQVFMYFFGAVFLVTGVLILIFKNERSKVNILEGGDEEENRIIESLTLTTCYRNIFRLFRLVPIREAALVLMTQCIGFAADGAFSIKLVEYDVPRETVSLIAIPMGLVKIVWPIFISRYIGSSNPCMFYYKCIGSKVIFQLISALFAYYTPSLKDEHNQYSTLFYTLYVVHYTVMILIDSTLFIALFAFFDQKADPCIGGTFMTLLATLSNMGSLYPSTIALYLIGFFTVKVCLPSTNNSTDILSYPLLNQTQLSQSSCGTPSLARECTKLGKTCVTQTDAFYIVTVVCAILGFIWLALIRNTIKRMSLRPKSEWTLTFDCDNKQQTETAGNNKD